MNEGSAQFREGVSKARWFLAHLGIDKYDSARLLDAGFGGGEGLIVATEMGFPEVVGADPNPFGALPRKFGLPVDPEADFLRWAGANADAFKKMRFYACSLEKVPNEVTGFDVCVTLDTMEHVSDVTAFVKSCFERLAPGGIFLSSTGPLYYSRFGHHMWSQLSAEIAPWVHLRKDFRAIMDMYVPHSYFVHEFYQLNKITAFRLRQVIMSVGFKIIDERLDLTDPTILTSIESLLVPELDKSLLLEEAYYCRAYKP